MTGALCFSWFVHRTLILEGRGAAVDQTGMAADREGRTAASVSWVD